MDELNSVSARLLEDASQRVFHVPVYLEAVPCLPLLWKGLDQLKGTSCIPVEYVGTLELWTLEMSSELEKGELKSFRRCDTQKS